MKPLERELRDSAWVNRYEATLTNNQWNEWKRLQQEEREFAKNCGYDFGYGRYWETLTLQELREAQP